MKIYYIIGLIFILITFSIVLMINSNENFKNNEKIRIIQHGKDGCGHQLHGLISAMALHGIDNYYFDAYCMLNKKFSYEHLNKQESKDMEEYVKNILREFIKYENVKELPYKKVKHVHEIYKIPGKTSNEIVYSIDNCYYTNKIKLTEENEKKYFNNLEKISKYFNNSSIPANRLDDKNIVIHFRLGDAMKMRGNSIKKHNENILKLINMFENNLSYHDEYTYYLHTDGDISWFTKELDNKNIKYFVYGKKTGIFQVLSDFYNSKIFVSGDSGLSKVATNVGQKKIVIIPDNNKQLVSKKSIKISNYNPGL